jgi:hypothetical protein
MGSKAIRPLYGGRSVAASTERRFRLGTWDLPWVYHGFNRCFLIFMIYMYISNIIYIIYIICIYIYISWIDYMEYHGPIEIPEKNMIP